MSQAGLESDGSPRPLLALVLHRCDADPCEHAQRVFTVRAPSGAIYHCGNPYGLDLQDVPEPAYDAPKRLWQRKPPKRRA